MTYGPVAGTGRVPSFESGVPAGRIEANGMASLYRNSGSGAVRRKVTVPASSSVTIPSDRSHAFGCLLHAAPPRIDV